MSICSCCSTIAAVLALSLGLAGQSNELKSTFDTELEGWTVNVGVAVHRASGGNGGGYLFVDNPESDPVLAVAPGKFRGDLRAFDGGVLSFDGNMLQRGVNPPNRFWEDAEAALYGGNYGTVTVRGAGLIARKDLEPREPPVQSWKKYSTPFTASAFGVTQDQWVRLLANVSTITVSLEAIYGQEQQGFDNFIMTGGTTSAAPPTTANTRSQTALDPVATATGEFSEFALDLNLGGPLPLTFQRFHASALGLNGISSALGANWMHNFEARVVATASLATVVLFPGKTVQFQREGSGWRLLSAEERDYQLVSTAEGYQFRDAATSLVHRFDATGALVRVEDRNGNALSITRGPQGPTRVEDGLGRSLTFRYQGSNLVEVADQTGRRIGFQQSGGNLTQVTDPEGKTHRYNYAVGAPPGLVAEKVLPAGNKPITTTYDSQGRVTRQTDSRGNSATVEYDRPAAGMTTLTDPLANVSRHTHQDQRLLTLHSDPSGRSTTLTYDARQRPTTHTDRHGNRVSATYDSAGNPASVTDATGNTTRFTWTTQTQGQFQFPKIAAVDLAGGDRYRFSYDNAGNLASATDPAGKTWTYTYNRRGQLLTARNPLGGVTSSTYNDDGTQATITQPSGETIRFEYDALKRPSRILWPDGTSRQFTYNNRDQTVTATDERGKTTRFSYNDNGRLSGQTDPHNATAAVGHDNDERISSLTDRLGNTVRFEYDAVGRLQRMTHPSGQSTTVTRDAAGQAVSVSDSAGLIGSFTRDSEGRISGYTDAASNRWSITQDPAGRITQTSEPDGGTTRFTYDASGRLSAMVNPLNQRAEFTWDPRNLPSRVTLPGAISAQYIHNDLGLLSRVVDPNGNGWSFDYDSQGRLGSTRDPLNRATTYSYDARGRVRQVRLPEGAVDLAYDGAGNVVRQQYTDGAELRYSFDDSNRLVSANSVALGYDAENRIIGSNGLVIGWDEAERIASVTYAAGKTVRYTYDSRGLLTRITDWLGGSTEFGYNSNRQITSIRRPNGVLTLYTYDAAGRVARIDESGGNVNGSIAVTRDAWGRVTAADRTLPAATDPPAGSESLAYDAAHQETGGAVYDALGRAASAGGNTFTWDQASRLTRLHTAAGADNFSYDALGLLVAGRHNYVWNYALDLPSVAVFRRVQADLRYFVHLPNGTLLYAVDAASQQRSFYHFDEAGNTVFLTGDNGAVTDSYALTPFGEVVSRTGTTDNPFVFQGQYGVLQIADTNLYYMRARWYDAAGGRFLSPDPELSLDPRRINPYPYAFGDPVNYIDPVGLCGELADDGAQQLTITAAISIGALLSQYAQYMMADYYAMLNNYRMHSKASSAGFWLSRPIVTREGLTESGRLLPRRSFPAGWRGWARQGIREAYRNGRPWAIGANLGRLLAGLGIALDAGLTLYSGIANKDDPAATALNVASTGAGDACIFAHPGLALGDLLSAGLVSGGIGNFFRSVWVVPGILGVERFTPAEARKVERWYTGKAGTRFVWWSGEQLADFVSTPVITCECKTLNVRVNVPNPAYQNYQNVVGGFEVLDWLRGWLK